jgi:hypothetical protein
VFHLHYVTQHSLNPLMMDSGEVSFHAVLIHCPSSASDGLMFPAVATEHCNVTIIPHTRHVVGI